MKNTAFLFPGQGSQKVGMAADLYNDNERVRELFDMAEEITKTNLSTLCFKGPIETLTETVNLQPAMTVVNLSWLAMLQQEGVNFTITAGHSLGEYSALTAAGVISNETAFRLVHKRATLMHRESKKQEGAMSAVINLNADTLQRLINETEGKSPGVCMANHNAETQIVISGLPSAVQRISALAKKSGGMAIPLKVSGAWHSPLMKGAEDEFREFISDVSFQAPEKEIIFNVSANSEVDPVTMKNNMVDQLCSPVKWYESVTTMIDRGIERFIEIGPGTVLSGLVKKTVPKDGSQKVFNVNSIKNLEKFLKDDI